MNREPKNDRCDSRTLASLEAELSFASGVAVRYELRPAIAWLLHDHVGQFVVDPPAATLVDENDLASQLDDGSVSIVTLSIDTPSQSSKAAIILDIDVVKTLDNVPPVTETLWSQCEELRTWKNSIFDASLTPKAKKLFR